MAYSVGIKLLGTLGIVGRFILAVIMCGVRGYDYASFVYLCGGSSHGGNAVVDSGRKSSRA